VAPAAAVEKAMVEGTRWQLSREPQRDSADRIANWHVLARQMDESSSDDEAAATLLLTGSGGVVAPRTSLGARRAAPRLIDLDVEVVDLT
jgi:hypothetical protein